MIVHTLFIIVSLASQIYGDWLSNVLTYQRELTRHLPLNENILFGTHNSFNYYNPKYTFPDKEVYNQDLNITEQLNLGIRYINLDIHFIPQLNDSANGALRVCHASKKIYDKCMQNSWQYCSYAGIPNYGASDSGCFPFHWTFDSIIQELLKWISQNPREFILVEFDDGLDSNERTISRSYINQILQSKLGNKILLPSEFTSLQSKWPSLDYLVTNLSKNIAFSNSYDQMIDDKGFTFLFKTFHNDENYGWPATMIKYFNEEDCSSSIYTTNGFSTLSLNNFGFFQEDLSIIDLGTFGGVVYDGTKEVGTFNQSTVQKVLECGQTTWLEKLTAEKMRWNVWSWDSDQIISTSTINSKCAVLNYNNGRWKFVDCSTAALFACQSDVDRNDWKFTEISKSWNDFSRDYLNENESISYCPSGYSYSVPINPHHNGILRKKALQLKQNVYILTRSFAIEDGSADGSADGNGSGTEVTSTSLVLDSAIIDKNSGNSITINQFVYLIIFCIFVNFCN